jgi:hypothetical protein
LFEARVYENVQYGVGQEWANSGPLRVFLWPAKTEKFNLLCYPITVDIEELQLELIDLQSDQL